jgi:peroxiredoxin Q/BCP
MRVGESVADFTAQDHNGKDVRLSALLSDGAVVLYFYPKAMTPG